MGLQVCFSSLLIAVEISEIESRFTLSNLLKCLIATYVSITKGTIGFNYKYIGRGGTSARTHHHDKELQQYS